MQPFFPQLEKILEKILVRKNVCLEENHLPRLPGSALKVELVGGVVVVVQLISLSTPTRVEVELG